MKRVVRSAVLFLSILPGTALAGQGVVPPEKWFGFRPGDRPATVEQILGYFEHLAENCLRARLEQYARSYEGRPLVSLIVSSPANIERMESIRRDLARLADPRSTTAVEAAELAARTPAVAWLAFSIHGDELSGSD
ncbi:MAG: zinc carboxypeptidase, partial [Deltaproteobacteria bacterium]